MSSLAAILLAITVSAFAQQPINKIQQLPNTAEMKVPATMQGGKINFPITLLPKIPSSLPVLKMTAQAPPEAFLTETLGKVGIQKTAIQQLTKTPALAARGVSPELHGVVQQEKVMAYWHKQSGEAEIYPQLEQLRTEKFVAANNPHLAAATSLARTVFARPEILPHDMTQFTLSAALPLLGTTAQKNGASGAVAPADQLHYLSYVAAHRTVQGYPVHGPGSRALLAIDNAGAIQAFSLHWKSGAVSHQAQETRNQQQVHSALTAVVQPLASMGDVHVLSAGISYYDDEGEQMAPAYRITVRVHPTAPAVGQHTLDDSFVILYAPYGNAPLSPTLAPNTTDLPQRASGKRDDGLEVAQLVPPGDPTVGRYVIQNAEGGWLSNAQGFWSGLNFAGGGSLFTNSQYYWAIPAQYTSNANNRVNSVQVALTEGHGNWWIFATNDHTDAVDIDSIPASGGYGSANHGHLNYWILHGCEIVPSAADAPCPPGSLYSDSRTWYSTWFKMFKGMHTVVGYRTVMWIDDGVGYPFGVNLRMGVPVISAWFNALNGASAYNPDATYQARCGNSPPMGRPSAVTVCGHSNDTIYNQENIPAPSCLTNFWTPN
jgi:hypothetical protein